ncbi:hypothetical protein YC2023_116604 [Brassica napus]
MFRRKRRSVDIGFGSLAGSPQRPLSTPVDLFSMVSELRRLNLHRKTVVYWDVEDYPVPNDIYIDSLRRDIESILLDLGWDDDFARMTWMLVDIICLPVVFPKPNVIVLSKHMEKEAVGCFQGMYFNGVGVLLSKTEPGWLVPDESSAFKLTRLFEQRLDCEKPQREDTLANSVGDSVKDYPCARLQREANVSS